MHDRDLLVEVTAKLEADNANQPGEPGIGETALVGSQRALSSSGSRWQLFTEDDEPRMPLTWALNGGFALAVTKGEPQLWLRDRHETIEHARDLALNLAAFRPHEVDEAVWVVGLSPRQARLALAKSGPQAATTSSSDDGSEAVDDADSRHSTYREKLLEHAFVSEVLQEAWVRRGRRIQVEILRSEIDSSGHDLVMSCEGVMRHIQLKASRLDAKTAKQNINLKLAEKPAGCVVWMEFTELSAEGRLTLGYRFFGAGPDQPLPVLDCWGRTLPGFKVARHTRGNKDGFRAERKGIIEVPAARFPRVKGGIEELLGLLFAGPFASGLEDSKQ